MLKTIVACGISILAAVISSQTAQGGLMTYMKHCSAIPDPLYSGEDQTTCGTDTGELVGVSNTISSTLLSSLLASPDIEITLSGTNVSAYSIFVASFDPDDTSAVDIGNDPPFNTASELASIEFPCGAHVTGNPYSAPCAGIYPNATAGTSFIIPASLYSQYFSIEDCSSTPGNGCGIAVAFIEPNQSPTATSFGGFTIAAYNASAPEPGSLVMVSVAGLAFALLRARRRRSIG